MFEYPWLRRYRIKPAQNWDKHSAKLWDFANLVEPLGMVLGFAGIGQIQFVPYVFASLGLLSHVRLVPIMPHTAKRPSD